MYIYFSSPLNSFFKGLFDCHLQVFTFISSIVVTSRHTFLSNTLNSIPCKAEGKPTCGFVIMATILGLLQVLSRAQECTQQRKPKRGGDSLRTSLAFARDKRHE